MEVLDPVGGVIDGAGPVGARVPGLGWGVVADGGEQIRPPPGRRRGGDGVEDVVDGRLGPFGLGPARNRLSEAFAVPAEGVGFVDPACLRFVDRQSGLGAAGVGGGFAFDGGRFSTVRVPALAFQERFGEQFAEGFDLGGALGERIEQVVGYPDDLRLALVDGPPADAVAVRELSPQDGLVDAANGLLRLLDVVGVEG